MSPITIAIIVTEQFNPFNISIPYIVFNNDFINQRLFTIYLCADHENLRPSSKGFTVQKPHGLDILANTDIIIIPYWPNIYQTPSASLIEALRLAHTNNRQIVGLCLGTFALAYAGLLDHKQAVTHWAIEEEFKTLFPRINLRINALYVEDNHIITSAGTAAAIDCCLYIVRQRYGSKLTNQIARHMVTSPYREGGQAQFIECPLPHYSQDNQINDLLHYLEKNLHHPPSLEQLASLFAMSRRTLSRRFIKATGCSIKAWINVQRLRQSQELLETSHLSMDQLATHLGYHSTLTFRKSFKKKFNVTPSQWRKNFQNSF